MAKPKSSLSAMSLVFGRQKEAVSKSWSDMWEEDVEEDEEERTRQLQALKELNSRTWSQESRSNATPTQHDEVAVLQTPASGEEKPEASPVDDTFNDIDGDLVADGFFFHEPVSVKQPEQFPPRYSPPSKRSDIDKWAALGERRRAYTATSSEKSAGAAKTRQQFGFGFNNQHGFGMGVWDNAPHNSYNKWNRDRNTSRDRPWNRGRDWNWRKDRRHDLGGDTEWVGNWQEAH